MRQLLVLIGLVGLAALVVFALGNRFAALPPLGDLLDPADGLYRTARMARHPEERALRLEGLLKPVTVVRDERGVPHIYAETDQDAVVALGYVVAQDRLFQLDLLPRVASGRLAEAFGPGAVEADRFYRSTGMDWAARRNTRRILEDGGIERDLLVWFSNGVNAYLDGLAEADLPFEFRLLGYRPDAYSPLQTNRLLQYMAFDLSYRSDGPEYAPLRALLPEPDFERLYPRHSTLYVPIVPGSGGSGLAARTNAEPGAGESGGLAHLGSIGGFVPDVVRRGFVEGKGSNNWAVSGNRSTTGSPILAGDMHLELTLPAIWYETHLVTPTMNTYGVTIPGAPLPVEAFNDRVGWAFTNTGADQIDHYRLEMSEDARRYRCGDAWCDLEAVPDTVYVLGEAARIDTLWLAGWGPVLRNETGRPAVDSGYATAIQWTAHKPSRTLAALWGMNHARDRAAFDEALTNWDTPMQNILYADVEGNISIRSTGHLPIRKAGHGAGLLDGSGDAFAWTGRVPFAELPHAENPEQGFLTSTNQEPAGRAYPYYLGHDWRTGLRSIRIDALLRGKDRHSVEDIRSYQADVHVVQRDLFVPLLDTLGGLDEASDRLRGMLQAWDGASGIDRPEPLGFKIFLDRLAALAWDEFTALKRPGLIQLWRTLSEQPGSVWLDRQDTPLRETGPDLLRLALRQTADSLYRTYGANPRAWRWGDHHQIVFRHLTRREALRPLWRGPLEYPGFDETLSPAKDDPTTHSASWRLVVDFSQTPPVGYGVYPGGQSGNPFSRFYDLHVPAFVGFRHYPLRKPPTPEAFPVESVSSRLVLNP